MTFIKLSCHFFGIQQTIPRLVPLRLVLPGFFLGNKTRPMRPKRLKQPTQPGEAQGVFLRGLASSFSRSSPHRRAEENQKRPSLWYRSHPTKTEWLSPKVWHQHRKMKLYHYHKHSQTILDTLSCLSYMIVQYGILPTENQHGKGVEKTSPHLNFGNQNLDLEHGNIKKCQGTAALPQASSPTSALHRPRQRLRSLRVEPWRRCRLFDGLQRSWSKHGEVVRFLPGSFRFEIKAGFAVVGNKSQPKPKQPHLTSPPWSNLEKVWTEQSWTTWYAIISTEPCWFIFKNLKNVKNHIYQRTKQFSRCFSRLCSQRATTKPIDSWDFQRPQAGAPTSKALRSNRLQQSRFEVEASNVGIGSKL